MVPSLSHDKWQTRPTPPPPKLMPLHKVSGPPPVSAPPLVSPPLPRDAQQPAQTLQSVKLVLITEWMKSPSMTVRKWTPNCSTRTEKLSTSKTLPAMMEAMPIGEYLGGLAAGKVPCLCACYLMGEAVECRSKQHAPRRGFPDSIAKAVRGCRGAVICVGNLLVNVRLCQRRLPTHVHPVPT